MYKARSKSVGSSFYHIMQFFSDFVIFLAFVSFLTILLCYNFFSHSKELFTFVPSVVLLSLYYSCIYWVSQKSLFKFYEKTQMNFLANPIN